MVLEFQHRNSKEYLRGFTELIRVDQRPPEERGWVWAIVKHIVEIHDAKIELDSAPGVGTTVSVF